MINVRKRKQEIEGANAVPGLQAHEALQAQFGFGVGEAGAVRDRLAVGVADHVVVEDDAAHARELRTAGLQGVLGARHRLFGADAISFLALASLAS